MRKQPMIVLDKITPEEMRMVSAQGEQAAVKLWEYARDKTGMYWFWPAEHDDQAALVHCGDHVMAGNHSEGYGGRIMVFPTKDGNIPTQGPWNSNTDALFERTGVDLRDKHKTWGVVALKRAWEGHRYQATFKEVIHLDPPQGGIGKFQRIQEMAQKFADDLDQVVFYYSRSHSGGSSGPVFPSNWTEQQKHDHFYPPPGEGGRPWVWVE